MVVNVNVVQDLVITNGPATKLSHDFKHKIKKSQVIQIIFLKKVILANITIHNTFFPN